MDAIAGAVDVASPNTLETHQHIALRARRQFSHLIRKRRRRFSLDPDYRTKAPLVRRPIGRSIKPGPVPLLNDAGGKSFQIRFGAAAGRKSAPDKSYGKFSCHVEQSRDIPSCVDNVYLGIPRLRSE
jgi:hypothetical protein